MSHMIKVALALVACVVCVVGLVSDVKTVEMVLGVTGLMVGAFLLVVQWVVILLTTHEPDRPRQTEATYFLSGASTVILTGLVLLLTFAALLSLMLSLNNNKTMSTIVCAVAVAVLSYVSVPLFVESVAFVRALAKREEYA